MNHTDLKDGLQYKIWVYKSLRPLRYFEISEMII